MAGSPTAGDYIGDSRKPSDSSELPPILPRLTASVNRMLANAGQHVVACLMTTDGEPDIRYIRINFRLPIGLGQAGGWLVSSRSQRRLAMTENIARSAARRSLPVTVLIVALGCGEHSPSARLTAPTEPLPSAPTTPTPTPTPTPVSMIYHVSGIVRDDDGSPLRTPK